MPRVRVSFEPGIVKDDTSLAARPRWVDGNNVRFYRGRPQPNGGYDRAAASTLTGKCRGQHAWSDTIGNVYGALGTHRKLHAYIGGVIHDITPIRSIGTLGANPIVVSSAGTLGTFTHTAHGTIDDAYVYLHGASVVGGVQIGGTAGTLGSNPFVIDSGASIVNVTHTAHDLAHGEIVHYPGTATVGGITINGDYTINYLDTDGYEIHVGGTATADGTGGGTAAEYRYELNPGKDDSEEGGGFGVGLFGTGGFGASGGGGEAEAYPRTWTFGDWGGGINASPRGGTIYEWSNSYSTRAAAVSNAPSQVSAIAVTPERILTAIGAHDGTNAQPMRDLLQAKLKPHRRAIRSGTMPEEMTEALMTEVIAETVVLDWENVELKGETVPFSKKAALEILSDPEMKDLRDMIVVMAGDMELFRAEDLADAEKKLAAVIGWQVEWSERLDFLATGAREQAGAIRRPPACRGCVWGAGFRARDHSNDGRDRAGTDLAG